MSTDDISNQFSDAELLARTRDLHDLHHDQWMPATRAAADEWCQVIREQRADAEQLLSQVDQGASGPNGHRPAGGLHGVQPGEPGRLRLPDGDQDGHRRQARQDPRGRARVRPDGHEPARRPWRCLQHSAILYYVLGQYPGIQGTADNKYAGGSPLAFSPTTLARPPADIGTTL